MRPADDTESLLSSTAVLVTVAPRRAIFWAMVNTLKSVLGTGLLAMPWAFLQMSSHLLGAMTLCTLLGVWSCYTMLLLYESAVLAWPAASGYSELVNTALGSSGGLLCAINLVLHQVLCVASYLVFIGDTLQDVLGGSSAAITTAAAVPVVFLCWLKDVRALGPASAIGTAALLIALCLVVQEACMPSLAPHAGFGFTQLPVGMAAPGRMLRGQRRHGGGAVAREGASFSAFGAFAGITTFTFCGHDTVLPVVLSFGVSHPRHAPYGRVVLVMAAIAIPAVLAFGIATMGCLGEELVKKNILLSVHSRAANGLKLLMAGAVVCTSALKMFPAFDVCEAALGLSERADVPRPDGSDSTIEPPAEAYRVRLSRLALRSALVLTALALALVCPDFEFITAFVGAFCNALICFVLPPLMYVALMKSKSSRGAPVISLCAHALLAAVGILLLIVGTLSVISEKAARVLDAQPLRPQDRTFWMPDAGGEWIPAEGRTWEAVAADPH